MVTVCIVHHSITGTTANLAASILEGVVGVDGCVAKGVTLAGTDIVEGRFRNETVFRTLDAADAVILGSPTFMGGPSSQFKAFADASSDRWETQRWEGKLCAGFTVGSSPSGDQLATLQYFTILAAQHGMLWVGLDIPGGYDPQGRNRLGAQLGLVSQSTNGFVPDVDLITARYLGARVARKALLLAGKREA
jgi:NAD(P)H dehydrogenase (quinone)